MAVPTSIPEPTFAAAQAGESIRVRGTVQGVGFRPFVWRLANELGITGLVMNDGDSVLIEAVADAQRLGRFVERMRSEAPPLARIAGIERAARRPNATPTESFVIAASRHGSALTAVPADAATCADCVAEIFDPSGRRFRYPLTNCSHCGPRLSIITGMPFDRPQTTMSGWTLCADCRAEYENPADRRFHAQAIACQACGPKLTLRRFDGSAFAIDGSGFVDACDAAGSLLARGMVLAIKGLGGYQLACDATEPAAVERLRALKRREAKPFALLAADIETISRYCELGDGERQALQSPAAPIVLLRRHADLTAPPIADAVAPGLDKLGFMLPSTGILHLVMQRMKRPIVLTSGNLSDEPQAITLAELGERFAAAEIDFVLDHQRPIARRVDDSVVRFADGQRQVLRRARGLAPQPLQMPAGFESAPPVLAYGAEQKNAFCLLRDGQAVLSQHIGELTDAAVQADYRRALADLLGFYAFEPQLRACDAHPGYLSTQLARQQARADDGSLAEVQHHHAHVAACLVDNGWPLDAGPVIGVALDGLGHGIGADAEGEWWGGEFAVVDYVSFDRRGCFKPVALLGGDAAAREPWRNTYAHLMATMAWPEFATNHAGLELQHFLAAKPRELLDAMLARNINSPLASSCGRLFDAVAAALGICRDHAAYEGQGAVELEATVDRGLLQSGSDDTAYPFAIARLNGSGLPHVEPLPMWAALLGDLRLKTPLPTIAARFHLGLTLVIVRMVDKLADGWDGDSPLRHVALSGGVFQNRILLELVATRLRNAGYSVLSHRQIPCNDGGLAIGQAAVAAALALRPHTEPEH